MQGHGGLWRDFSTHDRSGGRQIFVAAVQRTNGRIETEINRQVAPGSLFDGAEASFRQIAERNAGLGIDGQEAFVIQAGEIQAEAVKIVRQENRAANFGVDGVSVGVGKGQPEGERGKLVEIGHETPAQRQ